MMSKLSKLLRIFGNGHSARVLAGHRVAAAMEHREAIQFCAPRTLIDVGANKGQFSTAVRSIFPETAIHAFEPLPDAINVYRSVFTNDTRTNLHEVAIGKTAGEVTFYVTDRSDSSSLLQPGSRQAEAYDVRVAKQITISVKRLEDEVALEQLTHPVMMKIDVQGAELDVLQGIADLSAIDFIYVELSFVELYEGQPLLAEVQRYLEGRGFKLRGAFNQSFTLAFGPTQVDCLFEQVS